MFYKIGEDKLKKIEEITCTDYESKMGYVTIENLINIIDDLMLEIDRLEEKIKDVEQDIENNYQLKDRNEYEEYGLNLADFM